MENLAEKISELAGKTSELLITDLISAIKELQAQQQPNVMDAKQAAAYIKVSYWKFTIMAKNGEVPHWREGSRIFSRREELDEWMHERIKSNMAEIQKSNKIRRVK